MLAPRKEALADTPETGKSSVDYERLAAARLREVLTEAAEFDEDRADPRRRALEAVATAERALPKQRAAGHSRKGRRKRDPEEIRGAFCEQRGKVKHRSEACRRVAKALNISAETVRQYTHDLDW
jgi:Fe-S-cluster formation regulator IscX/YfhJ